MAPGCSLVDSVLGGAHGRLCPGGVVAAWSGLRSTTFPLQPSAAGPTRCGRFAKATTTAKSSLLVAASTGTGTLCLPRRRTKPEHVAPLRPPFDIVLAADCIYHEGITEHFHRTVMDVTNDKSLGGWLGGWLRDWLGGWAWGFRRLQGGLLHPGDCGVPGGRSTPMATAPVGATVGGYRAAVNGLRAHCSPGLREGQCRAGEAGKVHIGRMEGQEVGGQGG